MGKSLVIKGLRAFDIGLGNIYSKNEEWILQVDKKIFETNLSGSSYIQGVTLWFGSNFNNGDNIFSEKLITTVRGYFKKKATISFGYHDGSLFTPVISDAAFDEGYQELRFENPYFIPKNNFMAMKIVGNVASGGNGVGFTYLGFNYTINDGQVQGSTTGKLFMDFKVRDRIEMTEKVNGKLLKTNGEITDFGSGAFYKYSLVNVNTIAITGHTSIDLNSGWALYQLRKNGEFIKGVSSTQNDYDNYSIDVSEADEIWIVEQSGIYSPFEITVVD